MARNAWRRHMQEQRVLAILASSGEWTACEDVARAMGFVGISADRKAADLLISLWGRGLVEKRQTGAFSLVYYRATAAGMRLADAAAPQEEG